MKMGYIFTRRKAIRLSAIQAPFLLNGLAPRGGILIIAMLVVIVPCAALGWWSALQRPATPGFAWTSGSMESIGDALSFELSGYFAVTEVQLQFPVGDTYQFDLALFNSLDGTDEAYATVTVRFVGLLVCRFFLFFSLS